MTVVETSRDSATRIFPSGWMVAAVDAVEGVAGVVGVEGLRRGPVVRVPVADDLASGATGRPGTGLWSPRHPAVWVVPIPDADRVGYASLMAEPFQDADTRESEP